MPTYATLCDLGTFKGYDGPDEVYELDGRFYGVVEELSGWFYVYPWHGDPAGLQGRLADRPVTRNASAA